MYGIDETQRKEKLDSYYRAKALVKPLLQMSYESKLTVAVFDILTVNSNDKRTPKYKKEILKGLIYSKYKCLIDLFKDDNKETLKFFLDKDAEAFRKIWTKSFDISYQTGWARRPFRTRYFIQPHFDNAFSMLSDFINFKVLGISPSTYLDKPFEERFTYNQTLAAWISIEIDNNNKEIYNKVENAVLTDSGNLSRTMIAALTMSEDKRCHELLGKLLLSARLSEGLRQAIIETMDGGITASFVNLLKVILDNNLERFSSVVRGFDVWTGLAVSSEKPKTVRYYLQNNFIYLPKTKYMGFRA